jgi:hypothetical protein
VARDGAPATVLEGWCYQAWNEYAVTVRTSSVPGGAFTGEAYLVLTGWVSGGGGEEGGRAQGAARGHAPFSRAGEVEGVGSTWGSSGTGAHLRC